MTRFPVACVLAISILVAPFAARAQNQPVHVQRSVRGPAGPQEIDVRFLELSPADPSVLQGASLSMRLLLVRPRSAPIDVTQFVTRWISSNPNLASVDRGGQVRGLKQGAVKITADLGFFQTTTSLNVVVVSAVKFTVQPGDTPVSAVISPGVTVQVLDNLTHPLPGVAVSLAVGTNSPAIGHSDWPGTGTLTGTLSQETDNGGSATFKDLKIDFTGYDYTLVATAGAPGGAVSVTSAAFQEVRVNSCLGPAAPACSSGCPDSDGDGLNDAWKLAGGIDFNGDGVVGPQEQVLTNFDPQLPDGTPNPHPSAEPGRKDVFVRYDTMQVAGSGAACNTASDCGGHCSDTWAACGTSDDCTSPATCVSDQYCVGQCAVNTSRTCNTLFDCGGRCSMTTAMICSIDDDCPGGETCVVQPGEQCVNTTCHGHDDAPTPAALVQVIQAYDTHGINLHISPNHRVVPHAHVTSFGPPIDGCATPLGHVNDAGRAVDFYAVKPAEATGGGDQRPFIHYALFGHLHTCDSTADCNACATDTFQAKFRETGLSEIVGNDMILAFGAHADGNGGKVRTPDMQMAGTFMHELGHNLGLDHGGPVALASDHAVNFKPNYLSVMNYSFQMVGIGTAAEEGSIVPVTKRIDYSNAALAPLDEENLNETIGINSGTKDITAYFCPGVAHGSGSGPIDWDCNGDGGTETRSGDFAGLTFLDINNDGRDDSFIGGYADWPNLNFRFQCDANGHYGDGAAAKGVTSQELDLDTAEARHVLHPTKAVSITALPSCSGTNKTITPGAAKTVTVTLFGAEDLDLSQVNLASLSVHHAKPVSISFADVNEDGNPDLILTFEEKSLRLDPKARKLRLTGWLQNSQRLVGEADAGALQNANAQTCKSGGTK